MLQKKIFNYFFVTHKHIYRYFMVSMKSITYIYLKKTLLFLNENLFILFLYLQIIKYNRAIQ